MWKYPYVQSPKRLVSFLERLPSIGVPQRLDTQALRRLGFEAANDRGIVGVARFLGIIDEGGASTQQWTELRADLRPALGQLMQRAYAPLFEQYPDAHHRSEDELRAFFSVSTTAGAAAVAKTVTTFRALAGLAEFEEKRLRNASAAPSDERETLEGTKETRRGAGSGNGVSLALTIALPAGLSEEELRRYLVAIREELL